MGTYIDMDATLHINDVEKAKKVIYDTILPYYAHNKEELMTHLGVKTEDELLKAASVEQLLEKIVEVQDINEITNTYVIGFYEDCGYGWPSELAGMFEQMAPYLDNGSYMTMASDDDGGWYNSYEIKNGKLVTGTSHDFYTDDSNCPSDDDVADAIIKAAYIIEENPCVRNGLAKILSSVTSLQDIVDVLPS